MADLFDDLPEPTPLPSEQLLKLAKKHPPPQAWFDGHEPNPLARRGDPETSKQAGREIIPAINALRAWAAECVRVAPGKTQRELGAEFCPDDPRRIGRRLNECEEIGLVRRGPARKCSISGKRAATWWPPESGDLTCAKT